MVLTDRLDDAFRYARQLHQSQVRKGTTIPYIAHLMTVSALVIEHGGNEDQAIADLLHDAAEDQGGAATLAEIRAMFGDAVADIVADCTDAWTDPKPPWRARKEAYLDALTHKPQASLLVSLADKTHNAEAILFDYRALGPSMGALQWRRRRHPLVLRGTCQPFRFGHAGRFVRSVVARGAGVLGLSYAGAPRLPSSLGVVIAGLDPAIHRLVETFLRGRWTRGSSPRVTRVESSVRSSGTVAGRPCAWRSGSAAHRCALHCARDTLR
jgi:hypothetical protein